MAKIQNDLNGWIIVDKPYGMGSTQVVTQLKRLLHPKKIGHAGTLDPLATGVLPIALGKATKTIPFVMDGQKIYRFTVKWGVQTTTDDVEGDIVQQSEKRPTLSGIKAVLPEFIGDIVQIPPIYSAVKIEGKRAYDLARKGCDVDMPSRCVRVDALYVVDGRQSDEEVQEETTFEVVCGKGTYVRTLAHDMGQKLGCFGHVTLLRRLKCGPFSVADTILLANLEKNDYNTNALSIIPVSTALSDISVLAVTQEQSIRILHGQTLSLRDFTDEATKGVLTHDVIGLTYQGQVIALSKIERGGVKPFRILIDKI